MRQDRWSSVGRNATPVRLHTRRDSDSPFAVPCALVLSHTGTHGARRVRVLRRRDRRVLAELDLKLRRVRNGERCLWRCVPMDLAHGAGMGFATALAALPR
jgi:hypothetical protein